MSSVSQHPADNRETRYSNVLVSHPLSICDKNYDSFKINWFRLNLLGGSVPFQSIEAAVSQLRAKQYTVEKSLIHLKRHPVEKSKTKATQICKCIV